MEKQNILDMMKDIIQICNIDIDEENTEKVLDKMVEIAKDAGALGSKVTGTGRGGNINALTPGIELQEKVYKALTDAGYAAWKTKIGV